MSATDINGPVRYPEETTGTGLVTYFVLIDTSKQFSKSDPRAGGRLRANSKRAIRQLIYVSHVIHSIFITWHVGRLGQGTCIKKLVI
jgi:hypothetical protein